MIDELDKQVIEMLWRLNQQTLHRMQEPFQVATKTNYNDLVTSVDKQNEREIDGYLRQIDPGCQILSEEGFGSQGITDPAGHLWIVDPIDGTLNFVKQRDHFGIMLALYVDGQPTLGYIMDCMNKRLYHGGPGRGVFVNDQRLSAPADLSLREGLVSISSPLILGNVNQLPTVAKAASGLRMYGSAAMEMIGMLTGELVGYVSHLHPWDLAAGRVMAEELGLVVKSIDGTTPDVLSSNLVLIATKQVSREIAELTD
ncbi:inositol monophosphatase family protein [Limosilactobacillus antri]|uniref:Inositol monophosphatase n=1 Tax=Limosilactobacillus antri DSM 16041 TaxID=525309 RepID=C8P7S3_9LACO|nr:inositol monophosphatase family protein [Limosilactobacillus antri]EEW53432.1 inositol monophosphatase family protein [Limosilactobacillus antri DSM 16041]KRK60558.1 inositol monophosphatase [Limosilactobacillus antri DSM 16041]